MNPNNQIDIINEEFNNKRDNKPSRILISSDINNGDTDNIDLEPFYNNGNRSAEITIELEIALNTKNQAQDIDIDFNGRIDIIEEEDPISADFLSLQDL